MNNVQIVQLHMENYKLLEEYTFSPKNRTLNIVETINALVLLAQIVIKHYKTTSLFKSPKTLEYL